MELVHLIMHQTEVHEAFTASGKWIVTMQFDDEVNRVDLPAFPMNMPPDGPQQTSQWFVNWFVYLGKRSDKFVYDLSGVAFGTAFAVAKPEPQPL